MRIATIGAGYADGYRRSLQQIGKINVGGYICNSVGRISMDSLVIDVSHIPETKLANISQVCLLGTHYTAADMACDVSTISYEILTSLGTRPKRVYEE
jgi:alanine racemase